MDTTKQGCGSGVNPDPAFSSIRFRINKVELNPDPDRMLILIQNRTLKDKFLNSNFQSQQYWYRYKFVSLLRYPCFLTLKTKNLKKYNFFFIFLPLDPDSESGSTQLLNSDPLRIRIHNPATKATTFFKKITIFF
jgi:hypothetical protein